MRVRERDPPLRRQRRRDEPPPAPRSGLPQAGPRREVVRAPRARDRKRSGGKGPPGRSRNSIRSSNVPRDGRKHSGFADARSTGQLDGPRSSSASMAPPGVEPAVIERIRACARLRRRRQTRTGAGQPVLPRFCTGRVEIAPGNQPLVGDDADRAGRRLRRARGHSSCGHRAAASAARRLGLRLGRRRRRRSDWRSRLRLHHRSQRTSRKLHLPQAFAPDLDDG